MSARKPTAKERTVPMPGIVVDETPNRAPPIVEAGPTYPLRVSTHPKTLHIAESRHAAKALCGHGSLEPDLIEAAGLKTVCQACRAEASRLRATVVR